MLRSYSCYILRQAFCFHYYFLSKQYFLILSLELNLERWPLLQRTLMKRNRHIRSFSFGILTTVFYIVDSCPRTVHKDSNFFTSLQPVPFWVFDCSTLVSMRCQVLLWKVHSDIWLLVGMISSLKFNVIFDMVGFKPAGLLFIFSLLSLFCAPLFLIFCLLDYLNIFLKNQFQLSVFYLYLRTLPWWLR